MKPVRTWIVIADGGRGRIFENLGPGKGIEPVKATILETDIKATRDIMADKPGRSFSSVGSARHSMEPPSDPHREQKRQFAHRLSELLDQHRDDYDRLVVVAAPSALGDIRSELSDAVKGKVTAERAKDLTGLPINELPAHLEDLLPV